ncbi:probable tetraacyldisaccharide 4'-kinase, mitochondrial isoform X2 [Vitis riparia]|uniref:probable tetraacyldisaccharide 4'-kinase, mitochondrial isoform X2 n=1 Tax=Vitis riparia TaxID=96939 RepID=UPI00155AFFE7|nr:probable tetraacyldisaccharide 4'-kinase, mitochondrial isoform X2 [Vitis riparia]
MEKLRKVVNEIAYTTPLSQNLSKLSPLQCSLIPLLFLSSSFYTLALSLRHFLYRHRLFRQHRLPVPVISVGNMTWGGNGKTPMVEFMALWLANSGISPLILSRGYAGGDEAKMLQRRLLGRSAKIGVGANRAATAAHFFERYGYVDTGPATCLERLCFDQTRGSHLDVDEIGAVILDDGMQHRRLWRDLEIVMVNGLMPWGNCHLLPLGPLREPLTALRRADVAIVHHADLVLEQSLEDVELKMQEIKESLPIFFTRMAPSHFLEMENINSKMPLRSVCDKVVLCVSAIGFANAFVETIGRIGALYVDRLDFSDHHLFQAKDVEMIRMRLGKLQDKFGLKPVVVVTEKMTSLALCIVLWSAINVN